MMKWLLAILLGVGVSLAAIGCGSGDDDGGGYSGYGVTGKWSGFSVVDGKSYPTWATFSQSGTQVTGTLENQYSFSGTLNGNAMLLTMIPVTSSSGLVNGSISSTVSGNSMEGTYILERAGIAIATPFTMTKGE
jgi:hypothetical protein